MNRENGQQHPRIWVVLTFGDARQYAGNVGYNDDPSKFYSYDSYVANHLQITAGDHVIICDRKKALGIGRIEKIDAKLSTRLLQRCPECKLTGIKKRKSKVPLFRCNSGHEFDEPLTEQAECTQYTAFFGTTFKPFEEPFERHILREGCPRYSDQLAMQEFVYARLGRDFRASFPQAAELIASCVEDMPALGPEAAQVATPDGMSAYVLTAEEARAEIFEQIRARRGQQQFRDKLRKRYGDQCMVSGSRVLHVIEAAYICPYRGESDNHEENGLLLRADIHTLFDLNLIAIEPLSLEIHVHPDIRTDVYAALHGTSLITHGKRPSESALVTRWKAFTASAEPEK